jgi:hypothetical protein
MSALFDLVTVDRTVGSIDAGAEGGEGGEEGMGGGCCDMAVSVSERSEWGERRRELVTGSGSEGQERGVSHASPRVQPLHEAVQNGTTTGQTGWKLLIRPFLQSLS